MSVTLSEVPKFLRLSDEQMRMLPQDKYARRAVMRLLRRVYFAIKMDVAKRPEEAYSPREEYMDQRLVYTFKMRRRGVVFDEDWFSDRDCSVWLPGVIREHWKSMVFRCRLVNARIDHFIPRHFCMDGALMTGVWVTNANGAEGEPHRLRIQFDREIFSAYLEHIEWSPRTVERVLVFGQRSLDFLPLPESVLQIVLRFLRPQFSGTVTSLRENGSRSIFPFKFKPTQRLCLGKISRMHVSPGLHPHGPSSANYIHGF